MAYLILLLQLLVLLPAVALEVVSVIALDTRLSGAQLDSQLLIIVN